MKRKNRRLQIEGTTHYVDLFEAFQSRENGKWLRTLKEVANQFVS